MPIPVLKSRRAHYFDAELGLRARDATALAATGASTGVELRTGAVDVAKVVVDHSAITGTINEDNNWTVNVQISDELAGDYVTIATTGELLASANQVELPIGGLLSDYLEAGAMFIRVQAVKAGTIGDLSFGAYVSPTP